MQSSVAYEYNWTLFLEQGKSESTYEVSLWNQGINNILKDFSYHRWGIVPFEATPLKVQYVVFVQ